MATPIKFNLPAECRTFTLFPRLPIEIRHKIWEAYLSEPGINFVKLQICDRGWNPERIPLRPIPLGTVMTSHQEPADESASVLDAVDLMVIQKDYDPRPLLHAKLVALSPNWRADASHYEVLYRQLANLSMTCAESASLVKSLVSRPGVLRMENGNIVTLDKSPGLVFLDYLSNDIYQLNFTLDIRLFCPGLDLVRRVAVRFSHSWKPEKIEQRPSCASPTLDAGTQTYPIHLYQFLARCLPNLEEFYLVDYFVVLSDQQQGRPLAEPARGSNVTRNLKLFRRRNRNFCEIDDGPVNALKWKIDYEIFEIRDWLRDRFLRYARASHTSRHKTPEQVHFGVLACDWNVEWPATCTEVSPVLRGQLGAKSKPSKSTLDEPASRRMNLNGGHRPKRYEPSAAQSQTSMISIDLNMSQLDSSEPRSKPPNSTPKCTGASSEMRPGHTSDFEFGLGGSNSFNSNFKKAYGSQAQWAGT